jgi:hypothetical protein
MLKLRAAIWDIDSGPLDKIDSWKPRPYDRGAEYGFLSTLRRDLLHLKRTS